MKFILATTYAFWWPVKVQVPSGDTPGVFDVQTLKIRFEAIPDAEVTDHFNRRSAITDPVELRDHDHALMKRVIRNWEGVVDDAGNEVGFDQASLSRALGFLPFRTAVARAYADAMAGKAAEKN